MRRRRRRGLRVAWASRRHMVVVRRRRGGLLCVMCGRARVPVVVYAGATGTIYNKRSVLLSCFFEFMVFEIVLNRIELCP